ncbi:biopolymer transporter ExbD [Phaeobacter sp. HF9A]|uniref:ExbD/TolR family protein n=1 Tax=Phaeobacter sp. HF9A TaxID=2721561 RepID=UPI001430B9F2|nr:biopolymer transporter ExbD [Phaeobacter sp. HF9A]NIZ13167.1 biopolymer transporter ExbD [Phaeobacter sp. HF9A]
MKLRRPARGSQGEPITALIDVVFFLLVFFMLIGRMDATAPFDVSPPQALSGQDLPAGGATLSLSAAGDLALDGNSIDRDALAKTLRQRLAQNADLRLRINAHKDAEVRSLLPLIAEAEEIGLRDIVLVVTPAASGTP